MHQSLKYIAMLTCAFFVMIHPGINAYGDDDCRASMRAGSWIKGCHVPYVMDGKQYSVSVQIYCPRGYLKLKRVRTLIGLHGYRFTMRDWERNTAIGEYADRYGFVIICPDMGITLYESRYYPETTARWGPMPGGRFVSDILIPHLRKRYGLARDRMSTGIFGLSTGGRGAVLLAAKHPSLIGAAAGLSGDYDPEGMIHDPLLTSIYGKYESHRERWRNDDNVMALAGRLKGTCLYLGHGAKDVLVPPAQTAVLVKKIEELNRVSRKATLTVEREISPRSGHDWTYWRSCVPSMMKFFNESLR